MCHQAIQQIAEKINMKDSASNSFTIPGYRIFEETSRGQSSIVYRAEKINLSHSASKKFFAIKVMRDDLGPQAEEVALRFRKEASALARMRHTGLLEISEVGQLDDGRPYLVMEKVEGQELAQLIERGPLSQKDFLEAAKKLTQALAEVHRHGLIHRDIKPSNILMVRQPNDEFQPKLVDFGFVAQATAVWDKAKSDEVIGTILYAPPEQTGMLKRPTDARSDLYSLGVLFFECATGKVPFQSNDAGELMRMHAVSPPPKAHEVNPNVSPILSVLVSKLLSKDPDDRYQTALGLLADLENLASLSEALKANTLKLGKKDFAFKKVAAGPFVGRTAVVEKLKGYWKQANRLGRGAAVLIEGESGSGKSRIAQEVIKKAQEISALSLSGRALQSEQTPFASLREAIDDYILSWDDYSELERSEHSKKLCNAAGELAPIIKRLSIKLQKVLEEDPRSKRENISDDQQQFLEAVVHFLSQLSLEHKSALLFIDDIQWMDDASKQVITKLVHRVESIPLLFLGTTRSDQVFESSNNHLIDAFGKSLNDRIKLTPLDIKSVSEVVAANLGGQTLDLPIIEKLANRSNGNPFVLNEYIQALLNSGALYLGSGGWKTDEAKFDAQTLSADVLLLVVNRVRTLSSNSAQILRFAAVAGKEFGPTLLSSVTQKNKDEIAQCLIEAMNGNLVDQTGPETYTFVHERVKEALISEVKDMELKDLHHAVGEYLYDHGNKSTPGYIFTLARLFERSHADRSVARRFEVYKSAAIESVQNYSYTNAIEFANKAIIVAELLPKPAAGLFEIHETLAKSFFQRADFKQAIPEFEFALNLTESSQKKASIYNQISLCYQHGSKSEEAWLAFENGLAVLGKPLPKSKVGLCLYTIAYFLIALMLEWSKFGFGKSNEKSAKKHLILLDLYAQGSQTARFAGKKKRQLLTLPHIIFHSHFLGNRFEVIKPRGLLALALFSLNKNSYHKIDPVLSAAERSGDNSLVALCLVYASYIKHAAGEFEITEKLYQRLTKNESKWLPFRMSVVTNQDYGFAFLLCRGYAKQALDFFKTTFSHYENVKSESAIFACRAQLAATLILLGETAEAANLLQQANKDISDKHIYPIDLATYYHARLFFALEQEEFGATTEELLEKLPSKDVPIRSLHFYLKSHLIFLNYIRLQQYLRATQEERPWAEVRLKKCLMDFRIACEPHPHFWCHGLVIQSVLACEEKKFRKSARLLAQAERLAEQSASPWGLFEVFKTRAQLLSKQGKKDETLAVAQRAYQMSAQHRWVNRAKKIRAEFNLAELGHQSQNSVASSSSTVNHSSSSSSVASSGGSSIKLRRTLDALLQVSLASAKENDSVAQSKVALDEVVKLLGAERAFLFSCDEMGQMIQVQAGRDSDGKDLAELKGYSTKVVEKVALARKPLVVSGTEEGPALGSVSIATFNLRSIISTPLLLQEKLMGIVYLDSRLAKGMFTEEDVEVLTALSNHIAIAIETGNKAKLELDHQALQKDLQTKKIVQTILDNLDQGFITFDSSGTIQDGVSKAAYSLFGTEPQGKNIYELLQLDGKSLDQAKEWIRSLFEDGLLFDFAKDDGPKSFEKIQDKYVELDYRAIEDEHGSLEKVILVSTDKTKERELKAQAEEEARKVKLVTLALMNRPIFVGYIREIRSKLNLLGEMFTRPPEKIDANEAFRHAHSIKGSTGACYMTQLQDLAHEFESELSKMRSEGTPSLWQEKLPKFKEELAILNQALIDFLISNNKIIGTIDDSTERERFFLPSEVRRVTLELAKTLELDSPAYQVFYETFVLEPIHDLFGRFENVVQEVARKQSKVASLAIEPSKIKVLADAYEPLMGSLIHAFRNAVDHGLENPIDRQEMGKDKSGKIKVSFHETKGGTLKILIQDDGRGINPEIVAKLAVERGLAPAEKVQSQSKQEIIQYVFAPGFSSKSEVTDISGRGVGLDAIQAEAHALGGKVWVESEIGKGTILIVEVPKVTQQKVAEDHPKLSAA